MDGTKSMILVTSGVTMRVTGANINGFAQHLDVDPMGQVPDLNIYMSACSCVFCVFVFPCSVFCVSLCLLIFLVRLHGILAGDR